MIRPRLTEEELKYLVHVLNHFTDFMMGDDRPDHGFGILKGYRDLPIEKKGMLCFLYVKLARAQRRIKHKNQKDEREKT